MQIKQHIVPVDILSRALTFKLADIGLRPPDDFRLFHDVLKDVTRLRALWTDSAISVERRGDVAIVYGDWISHLLATLDARYKTLPVWHWVRTRIIKRPVLSSIFHSQNDHFAVFPEVKTAEDFGGRAYWRFTTFGDWETEARRAELERRHKSCERCGFTQIENPQSRSPGDLLQP